MPILMREAIQSQQADVDIVSGRDRHVGGIYPVSRFGPEASGIMIRRTWIQMGMPVTVCIRDEEASEQDVSAVASWFEDVNQRFSPYLETSEVCRLNAGAIGRNDVSSQFEEVLLLCEQTKAETGGYFDVARDGLIDPSGLVKGWAIEKASALLSARGFANHFVDAGGDVQAVGLNSDGRPWQGWYPQSIQAGRVGQSAGDFRPRSGNLGDGDTRPAYLQPAAAGPSSHRDRELDRYRSIDLRSGSIGDGRVRDGTRRTRLHRRATRIWRGTRLRLMAWRSIPAGSTTMFDRLLALPDRWLDRVSMYRLVIYLPGLLAGHRRRIERARDPRLSAGRSRWLSGSRGGGVSGSECPLRFDLWSTDEQ